MKPSPTFEWERLVAPARWVAGVLGIGWVAVVGFLAIGFTSASGAWFADVWQTVMWGLIIVGLIAALFWRRIGEIIGGLALIGGWIWFAANGQFGWGAFLIAAPLALAGLLFLASGWYTLAQRRYRTPQATG